MTTGRKKWFEFLNEKEESIYESYATSGLAKWLQHDNWGMKDALLILSNISPTDADIDWDAGYEHARGFWVDRITIQKVKLFSEQSWICSTPKEEFERREIAEELHEIRTCEQTIKYFKSCFTRAGLNEDQYPVGKYLKCVEYSGLVIPWLEWAKSDILSHHSLNIKSQILELYNTRKSEFDEVPVSRQLYDFKCKLRVSSWFDLDSWAVKDALLLLSDIDPKSANIDWDAEDEYVTGKRFSRVEIVDAVLFVHNHKAFADMGRQLLKEITETNEGDNYSDYELALLAMRLREFNEVEGHLNKNVKIWNSGFHTEDRYPINYYVEWGMQKGLQPEWLQWAQDKKLINIQEKDDSSDSKNNCPFLDEKHSYHARELKIAVEAWVELYEKQPPRHVPLGGHKKYITKWLEERYPRLGQRALDRISTVINPNHKGGASPINENF